MTPKQVMQAIGIFLLVSIATPAPAAEKTPQEILQGTIARGALDVLRWPDFSDFRLALDSFYASGGYVPVWSRDGVIQPQAIAIIQTLQQADSKGLDPEDYDGSRWAARIAHPDPVVFDVALTVSLMRYVSDVHLGKFNPGIYTPPFNIAEQHYELAELIRARILAASDVSSVLRQLEPSFPGYAMTLVALKRYSALAAQDHGDPFPTVKLPIKPGMPYPGIARLASLLRTLGDFPADAPVPAAYEGPLVDAVKRFQNRHGVTPDGAIGKETMVQLNTPLAQRVRQLQFALERWRWASRDDARPPIVINIPEFELRAMNDAHRQEFEMKVVVGHAYRRQTPVFTADLKYVIFRPYWNVPRSITLAELLPKIVQDSNYLAANSYEVVTKSNQVVTDPVIDDVTLTRLRSGEYQIRQVPGPKNSLGLVKFMFPNEHNVYLHDTPATELFKKSRRDFSHGCIRVENPKQLAAWVLRDKPEWDAARIDAAMHGEKPLQVDLPKPIPVLIVYATAVALENGEVEFFDDIYGFDAQLEKLSALGYPCCRWTPTSDGRGPRPRE